MAEKCPKMHGQPADAPSGSAQTHPQRPTKTRSQRKDDSIMGTNNSSIVSKRSVERMYFPNEPPFFRYFVKRPQRRSPLINRGYWVRMKAVDTVVHHFLEQPSEKKKLAINLGCGYDPLPWQCLSRYASACKGTIFIDVDYRDLMIKKRDVVKTTPELNSMLTNVELGDGEILFRSDQYIQVSCDLRDLTSLNRALATVVDIENCSVFLTAEVSITYMNAEAADAIIGWAAKLPQARFCLLEQILPDGIDQPFSKAMMTHFDKLQTPLGAATRYPTTTAQKKRFLDLGWPCVSVCNLWEMWSNPSFVSPADRKHLDSLEPFDEWEEFALFGCHYFLLVADTSLKHPYPSFGTDSEQNLVLESPEASQQLNAKYSEYPKTHGYRRFAAAMPIKRQDGQDRIAIFGGMGLKTRTNSYDVYSNKSLGIPLSQSTASTLAPSPRMCHTITDLGEISLLVGGRTGPDNGLVDTWLYHKGLDIWERVDDLPHPLYRHQAVNLGHGHVLISTGRIDSHLISNEFLVWSRSLGWTTCKNCGELPTATYGAVFAEADGGTIKDISLSTFGILAGGICTDALLQQEVWKWTLEGYSTKEPKISFERSLNFMKYLTVARFGANTINYQGRIYIIGGIIKDHMLDFPHEICILDIKQGILQPVSLKLSQDAHRPLFIGTSIVALGDSLLIAGGSAVCFSFGTFWNNGCYTLRLPTKTDCQPIKSTELDTAEAQTWKYMQTVVASALPGRPSAPQATGSAEQVLFNIPKIHINSQEDFLRVLKASKPAILEKMDIGPCVTKWTTDYLKAQIGENREIIVHEANEEHMDFKAKNFKYTTEKFGKFIDRVSAGHRLYLRALASDKPSELPANLNTDYPSIAPDFQIPQELAFVLEHVHSSPLRISGPVIMWLHYDVMANVYFQIQGSKRLLLFPPTDVGHFEFDAGSSSSHINVFEKLHDSSYTHPHEAQLQAGDALFLPPLWLHSASPTSGISVAVNVFFRNLETGYSAGKDVYGNRDLQAYEKGRQDIAKIIRSFDALPVDIRGFYLQRLASEFTQKAS